MALAFGDPYGGGQTDVDLGRSRLTPRDTYGVSPEGMRSQYNDQVSKTGQLVDALSGLTKPLNELSKQAEKKELTETEGLASSIKGQLDPNSPFAPQVANLLGDKSPKLQAAVLEAVGRDHATITAQGWIENMPEAAKSSPQATEKYFSGKMQEEAERVGGQNFYGPSYMNWLSDTFRKRAAGLSVERTKGMENILEQDTLSNRYIKGGLDALSNSAGSVEKSKVLLRKFEGFIAEPKWDKTAHRLGYGTDTVTKADGSVVKVTPGMRVTKEDAERDLARRIPDFQRGVVNQIGEENWNKYSDDAKAAITSVAYNYGSLPKRILDAVKSGDPERAAAAIESLQGDNDGINRDRRLAEASVIRGATARPVQVASASGLPTSDTKPSQEGADTTTTTAPAPQQKFENNTSLFTDQAIAQPMRPDVQRLQDHLMAEDERYRLVAGDGPYAKRKSKEMMMKAAVALAINKRDVELLRAVPADILTQDERDYLDKAFGEIKTMKWQDYTRQKTMEKDARDEEYRQFQTAATTKFVKTGSVDPDKDSMRPDGTIDFDKRTFLIGLQETSSLPNYVSKRNSANFQTGLMDAATVGKVGEFFMDDPKIAEKARNGQHISEQDIRDHILNRKDITPKMKEDLMEKVPTLLEGANLLADSDLERSYKEQLGSDVDQFLSNDSLAELYLMRSPTIKADLKSKFIGHVRSGIIASIEDGKGVPVGTAKQKLVNEALDTVRASWKEFVSSKGTKAPEATNNPRAAGNQNGTAQTQTVQNGTVAQVSANGGPPPNVEVGGIIEFSGKRYQYLGGDRSKDSSYKELAASPDALKPSEPKQRPLNKADLTGFTPAEKSAILQSQAAASGISTGPQVDIADVLKRGGQAIRDMVQVGRDNISGNVQEMKVNTYIETTPELKQEFTVFEDRMKTAKSKAEEQRIGREIEARYQQIRQHMIDSNYMDQAPTQVKPKPYGQALSDMENETVIEGRYPGRDKPIRRKKSQE